MTEVTLGLVKRKPVSWKLDVLLVLLVVIIFSYLDACGMRSKYVLFLLTLHGSLPDKWLW